MTHAPSSKIFLADQRGSIETDSQRRYSTFNFGGYYSEHKQPLGNLYAFNDEWLNGLQSVSTVIETQSYVVLIPVTGALTCRWEKQEHKVNVGKIKVMCMPANSEVEIINPYDGDWINYVQIHVQAKEVKPQYITQLFGFDLAAASNKLVGIVNAAADELPFSINIGNFMGREEALYKTRDKSQLFAFVLAGAFEIQGCLLHNRDGLAVSNVPVVDLEALSNNALMLLIELSN